MDDYSPTTNELLALAALADETAALIEQQNKANSDH